MDIYFFVYITSLYVESVKYSVCLIVKLTLSLDILWLVQMKFLPAIKIGNAY